MQDTIGIRACSENRLHHIKDDIVGKREKCKAHASTGLKAIFTKVNNTVYASVLAAPNGTTYP